MIYRYAVKNSLVIGDYIVRDQSDEFSSVGTFKDLQAAETFAANLNRLENLSTELDELGDEIKADAVYELTGKAKATSRGLKNLWSKITHPSKNSFWSAV